MKFTRTKKLVFFNNKWWVGKTTIAFNMAVKFAQQWYKTVLVDLDPQCNLSRLALWESFAENLFTSHSSIADVLKWIIEWWWDVDTTIRFQPIQNNLMILPGSLNLWLYEDLLSGAFSEAGSWQPLWYFNTSAIDRFLNKKWLDEDIDLYVIDASPSLWLLNRAILLWSDYFITPLMPDAFSLQWIQNLWTTLEKRKRSWKISAQVLAKENEIPNNRVLSGEWLFIWYIINSYNQYSNKPIKSHTDRMNRIPEEIKMYLSEKHCKNWLVEKSRKNSLVDVKDFWQLPTDAQNASKAIFDLIPWQDFQTVPWTLDNLELSKKQFQELFENMENILIQY